MKKYKGFIKVLALLIIITIFIYGLMLTSKGNVIRIQLFFPMQILSTFIQPLIRIVQEFIFHLLHQLQGNGIVILIKLFQIKSTYIVVGVCIVIFLFYKKIQSQKVKHHIL